jgi:hypothetical protein
MAERQGASREIGMSLWHCQTQLLQQLNNSEHQLSQLIPLAMTFIDGRPYYV